MPLASRFRAGFCPPGLPILSGNRKFFSCAFMAHLGQAEDARPPAWGEARATASPHQPAGSGKRSRAMRAPDAPSPRRTKPEGGAPDRAGPRFGSRLAQAMPPDPVAPGNGGSAPVLRPAARRAMAGRRNGIAIPMEYLHTIVCDFTCPAWACPVFRAEQARRGRTRMEWRQRSPIPRMPLHGTGPRQSRQGAAGKRAGVSLNCLSCAPCGGRASSVVPLPLRSAPQCPQHPRAG